MTGRKRSRQDKPAPTSLTVVGIGASAGGLIALQGFFDAMPGDTGMVFVVITHMDPNRESLLPELLQVHTRMPVQQVQGETAIRANHIYVISPNRRIILTDSHLNTQAFEEPRGQRAPIDFFFRSLAQSHRNTVAIILSGGGTDGAVGIKDIKEQGGLLLVQHPDEAEHDSMPRAAIATGLVDVVLPVHQMVEKLVAYQKMDGSVFLDPDTLADGERDLLKRILSQVQSRTGHDFSQYKQSTLLRRIERRMHLTDSAGIDTYLTYLRQTPDEARALFNDLLIGVTNFFRDRAAWQVLADQAIPRLFAGKEGGQTIRVWTIGCSTGEEAYTVAMLLLEYATRFQEGEKGWTDPPFKLQVFASDMDDAALAKAREGLYPEAIATDVSPERLDRFFTREGSYYRVRRALRDVVLFTNHSVLRDPPFSRIDLISCRNLLIYLNRDVQKTVLDISYYALNPEAYLFLGSAESASMSENLFRTLDKTHRLYQARPWRGEYPRLPVIPLNLHRSLADSIPDFPAPTARYRTDSPLTSAALHRKTLEDYGPPSVLIDDSYHILHVSETAGRYLQIRQGAVSSDLLKLIRPELLGELRVALLQAFRLNKAILTPAISVQFNEIPHPVAIAVRPRQSAQPPAHAHEAPAPESASEARNAETEGRQPPERLALVVFLEHEGSETKLETVVSDDSQSLVAQLQSEVRRLQRQARTNAEEYESANEALKATNEELQSVNEEYRSTAEELDTSKEELQSLNEELQTINAELKNKLEQLTRINNDLENLMQSTNIATLFLDRDLRIRYFTPGMGEVLNVLPTDQGRSITHLTNRLEYADLPGDATQVLRTLVPIERELHTPEGQWFLVRLRPYRTLDEHIDGTVLTFVDITQLKQTEAELRIAREYQSQIVETVRSGLLVLESDFKVQFANTSFLRLFQTSEANTIGKLVFDLGNGQWNIPQLRLLLEEILPQANTLTDFRVEHQFEQIGRRIMLLNARTMSSSPLILLVIDDVTEQEDNIRLLRRTNEELDQFARVTSHDLQEPLRTVINYLQFLESRHAGSLNAEAQEFIGLAVKGAKRMSDLIAALLAYARVEQRTQKTEKFDIQSALDMALANLARQIQDTGAQITQDELPRLRAEPVQMAQVFQNLISNALKFQPTHQVPQVHIGVERKDDMWQFSVRDNGIGVDVKWFKRIFAVFERLHPQEEYPGTGIGLALCKKIIEQHGGSIWVESAVGEGTSFYFTLPVTDTSL